MIQLDFLAMMAAALILMLGIWFGVTGSTGSLSRFAEISTVLLAVPVYLAALLFAFMLVGLIYLVSKLIRRVLKQRVRGGEDVGIR